MPWKEVSTMSLRLEFVQLATQEGANIRSLCRRFDISPKTAYKWLNRYQKCVTYLPVHLLPMSPVYTPPWTGGCCSLPARGEGWGGVCSPLRIREGLGERSPTPPSPPPHQSVNELKTD
jgi:hypothetical protein